MFVTFEGSDGSGKTTQIHLLAQHLRTAGHTVLTTREPGGTRIGDGIRQLLLGPGAHTEMNARAETLLFNAARAQLDRPRLSALPWPPATLSSAIALPTAPSPTRATAISKNIAELERLIEYATGGLRPDLTIYLDLPPEEGIRRNQGRADGDWNRLDVQELSFLSTRRDRLSATDRSSSQRAGPSSTPAAHAKKSITTSSRPCSKNCPPWRPAAEARPR